MINLKHGSIPFPYYTFDHEVYSSFMIKLMNALEFRAYYEGDILAYEMDEALEVFFLEFG